MMLQNHVRVKEPFKIQGTSVDFNVTEYEKFSELISNSTWRLTFKYISLVRFQCNIREEYPQLLGEAIKILLFYLHICLRLDF